MSSYAIRVNGVSKKYLIGAYQGRNKSLRDSLMHAIKEPIRRIGKKNLQSQEERTLWALKDVSFDIEPGEVVGIIGRNGAGKSTLLKILARITEPTEGEIRLRGRVGSLLEVGTGFHSELTGRENIFLNGAILGMKRKEIQRKFDEIVDFAEIEKFIDTPAKHYSSGMYMRLAFAVAAHLEPEILLVDEVLAVGDTEFQKKCLGKMEDVAKEGRTVLFVSHNLEAVLRLCEKALLLNEGKVVKIGATEKVLNYYLMSSYGSISFRKWEDNSKSPGNDIVRLIEVKAANSEGIACANFDITEPITISIEYEIIKSGYVISPAFNFHNDRGINIFDSHDNTDAWKGKPKHAGRYRSNVFLPGNFFSEGLIIVGAAAITPDPFYIHFHERDVIAFNIAEKMNSKNARGEYSGNFPGIIRPLFPWNTEALM